MNAEQPKFDPRTDPAMLLADIGEELLAIRRSGPIHDTEEAKILSEDVAALTQRVETLRRSLFEDLFALELRFHNALLTGAETFSEVNRLLIRYSSGVETVMAHYHRYRLEPDGEILLPLPRSLDLDSARRVHGDLPILAELERSLGKVLETLEVLDAVAGEIAHTLQSEHLQRYWLEQLGYIEIESVVRWIDGSLAGSESSEEDEVMLRPVPREYPRVEYLPGALFLDEDGTLLGRYRITLDEGSQPVIRTVTLFNLPPELHYPWADFPPEALLARIRDQHERLRQKLRQKGTLALFGDEDDILEI